VLEDWRLESRRKGSIPKEVFPLPAQKKFVTNLKWKMGNNLYLVLFYIVNKQELHCYFPYLLQVRSFLSFTVTFY